MAYAPHEVEDLSKQRMTWHGPISTAGRLPDASSSAVGQLKGSDRFPDTASEKRERVSID